MTAPLDHDLEALLERTNLSKKQLVMWMVQQRTPQARNYSMVKTFELRGPLDADRFERAFELLVANEAVLRTTFEQEGGLPQRRVRDQLEGPLLQRIDLRDGAADDADAWVQSMLRRPFDLSRRCFEAALLRTGDARHLYVINQHHLITDSWSVALTYRRLVELYESLADDPAPAPRWPSYDEYVDYERGFLASRRARRARDFWASQLAQPLEPLTLFGRAHDPQSYTSAREELDLGPDRTARLAARADAMGDRFMSREVAETLLFTTAVAGWLATAADLPTVGIGLPIHNRSSASLRETNGLVMQLCPLRIDVDRSGSWQQLTDTIATTFRQALRHYELGPSQPLSGPAYHLIVNYHNTQFIAPSQLEMREDWVHSGHSDPGESLAVHIHDFAGSGTRKLMVDFDTAQFDADQRARVMAQLVAAVDAVIGAADQPVDPHASDGPSTDAVEQLSASQRAWLARQLGLGPADEQASLDRLVAYLIPNGDPPTTEALRTELRAQLPEFMVPSAFVALDAWPRTPNGKVDVDALPDPTDAAATDRPYTAPRSDLERTVCEVWARVLRVPRVGVDDDFFALGGHSIMATRLVHELSQALELEVLLGALFNAPTVDRLCRHLEALQYQRGASDASDDGELEEFSF